MTSFDEDTRSRLYVAHLWVEADGHDDMDLFITIKKLDEEGIGFQLYFGEPHPAHGEN